MKQLLLEYSSSMSLLYVEDDETLQNNTAEMLGIFFARVDSASNGEEGLTMYREFQQGDRSYDLVITDVKMPKLDGIGMAKSILDINPMQSIVIISAHSEIDNLSQAIDLGVSGFISKPINHDRLIKVLYKTTQAISDHRFVEEHVGQIEALNLKLDEKNRVLEQKNRELEKSLRLLDTTLNKEHLAHPHKLHPEYTPTEEEALIDEQIRHLVEEDLQELMELLEMIDNLIIELINAQGILTNEAFETLASQFSKYASTLSVYTFFDALSRAMSDFSAVMKNHPLPNDPTIGENVLMLLESFVYVLGKWQQELSHGDKDRINEYDDSLINDINTIKNLWLDEEAEGSQELDDIFDF
jgi:YesN/AraC family two-component response regulator